jgi:predicted phosphodiesterase
MPINLLFCSDIHDNIFAVRQMAEQERESQFDAIVVAGDIGSEFTAETLQELAQLKCPILYVYGNWDSRLPYDASFGPNCHHLHLNPIQCDELTFVGFSGCPTAWGENPIARQLRLEVEQMHENTIKRAKEEEAALTTGTTEAEAECRREIAALRKLARQRNRKASARKIALLERRRDNAISLLEKQRSSLLQSAEYLSYQNDLFIAWSQSLHSNRKELARVVAEFGLKPERTIVVTHERLAEASADFPGTGMFVFGHRHTFSNTLFRGSRFLNAAALDKRVLVRPASGPDTPDWFVGIGGNESDLLAKKQGWRNVNIGNYAIARWTHAHGFDVTRVPLPQPREWDRYWQRVEGLVGSQAPMLWTDET